MKRETQSKTWLRYLFSFLLILLIVGTASAQSIVSTEYGNGWQKITYSNGISAYSNHPTYLRWDGEYIPIEWLNIDNGNWTYLKYDGGTYYDLNRLGETLILPKSFGNYTFDLTDISLSFDVTPAQLNARSIPQTVDGINYWYIVIPDKAVKTRFLWDNELPVISNETGAILNQSEYDANGTLLWENYDYRVIGDERRLYYNQTARNFGIASSLITFKFDSWQIGDVGGNAWIGNSSFNNFMLDRNTNHIILPDAVTNGLVLYHKMSGSSGTTSYDMNLTSNNNGTLTNMNTGLDNGSSGWNSSGKFGNAISFDGVNDLVLIPSDASFHDLPALTFHLDFWHDDNATVDERFLVLEQVEGNGYTLLHLNDVDQAIHFIVDYDTTDLKKYSTASPFINGQWNSVTATWDGSQYHSNVHIYINGIEISYLGTSTDAVGTRVSDSLANLIIGNRLDGIRGFDGKLDNIRVYNRVLTNDEINQTMNNTMLTVGNLITWHDSGTGNETYQIDINATAQANSNYSAFYRTNGTGSWTAIGTANSTGNQSITLTIKYQNTDLKIELYGNSTATPDIIKTTFWTQTATGEEAAIEPEQVQFIFI